MEILLKLLQAIFMVRGLKQEEAGRDLPEGVMTITISKLRLRKVISLSKFHLNHLERGF